MTKMASGYDYCLPTIKLEPIDKDPRNCHRCKQCGFKAVTFLSIKRHSTQHYSSQGFNCAENAPETYKCANCPFQTNLMVYHNRHVDLVHSSSLKTGDFDLTNLLKVFTCRNCHLQTNSRLVFIKHGETCDRERKVPIFKRTVTSDTRQWLKCEHCHYQTNGQSYLQKHVAKAHLRLKRLTCELCSYKTNWYGALKNHMVSKHTLPKDVKWFRCERCSYKTKWSGTLKTHIKAKHATDKTKRGTPSGRIPETTSG